MADGWDVNKAVDEAMQSLGGATPEAPPSTAAESPVETAARTGRPLPKAWKREMESHWSKLPPEVHEYVHTREADVSRGILQYQQGHNSWNKLVEPFQEVLTQHPDVNPIELLQGLMRTHLSLLQGSPEQKKELVQSLMNAYGIGSEDRAPASPDPRIMKEINDLKKANYDKSVAEHAAIVEKFFADPKNKYVNDLAEDMMKLIQRGVVDSVEQAYKMALRGNDVVWNKYLSDQQRDPHPASKLNLTSNDTPSSPAPRKGKSIDDTINAVVQKHYGTKH